MILNDIAEPEDVQTNSHKCMMSFHDVESGWYCDRIPGVNRCLSGMTDFYQHKHANPKIEAWACKKCDYFLCSRCMKADFFLQRILNPED